MKTNHTLLLTALIFILVQVDLNAQTVIRGHESKKADMNFTELANYFKLHPIPRVKKMPVDEDEDGERRPSRHNKPNPSMIHLLDRESRSASSPSYGPLISTTPSPAPNDTFLSTLSPGTEIPPDTHGAVDSQYCVTAINSDVHIQNRTGGTVSDVSLDEFWSPILPAGTGTTDPRVHYDPYNRRWILITDILNFTTYLQSNVAIAVSATNDPTGTWHMFLVPTDTTGVTWLDFPCIGYNKKWVAVTGNMFNVSTGAQSGANVYVVDYATMLAGTGAPFTEFQEGSSFTIAPAITYDTTQESLFAIEANSGRSGNLRLWKISGPVGSPTIATVGYPATTQHWQSGPPGGGDFCPQVSIAHKIQAGDDRITSLTYRNHTLWCANTVFLPATGTPTRSSVMWWQVDTLANPIQNGLIDDPTTPTFFDYASITVNANNDALVGFGYLSAYIHPSAAYALHMHTDAADSMRAPFVFHHGTATYSATEGGSTTRWGDFSSTCIDPRNDSDFWTIQESSFTGTSPNWDTWWANVQICPKPAAPVLSINSLAPCVGDTAVYAIHSITGATSYSWIYSGTGWGGSSTDTSIMMHVGTGVATIGVLAYNSCGEGETYFFKETPITAPPATPSALPLTAVCFGGPAPVFLSHSLGADTFNWSASGAGWSGMSASPSYTFTPTTVGTVTGTIIVRASNSCGTSLPDTIQVTPIITPTSLYSVLNHVTMSYINDTFNFTGVAPTGSTYTWNFNGGTAIPGTGAGPQSVSWSAPGLKTITLSVNNDGCISTYTDTVLVDGNLGVNGLNLKAENVSVQPNPNDGSFDVIFSQQINDPVSVKISDMNGRLVYSNEFTNVKNNSVHVTTTQLPSGTYVVSISSAENLVTKKITVIR